MSKIIDKINAKIETGEKFFSFEYFPPKTDEGVKNLHERQAKMKLHNPTFCDITWGGSFPDLHRSV
jgi:methylenetetrahydrofolate reductase (NADPH)